MGRSCGQVLGEDPVVETFHVYVVGAEDRSNAGLAAVAEAIAEHYGLPADDLLGRLSRGRFRVKTGVDRATADQYQRDLIKLGARVSIEPASPNDRPSGSLPPSNRPTPPAGVTAPPPTRPTPPAGVTAPPPSRPTPPSALGPPRPSTPPPVGGLQSGLAAAFSGDHPAADLSALDKLEGIALASLDGIDDTAVDKSPQFAPPAAAATKPDKPAADKPAVKPPRPRDVPVDMDFAPPAEEAEMKVDIAPDELEHRARRRTPVSVPVNTTVTTTPAGGTPVPGTPPPPQATAPVPILTPTASKPRSEPMGVVSPTGRLGPLANERVRMAVGVVVAVLLGFLPAHFIASAWEHSAYRDIDNKVEHRYDEAAGSVDDYAMLDAFRDHELDAKRGSRNNIAVVALLIWAAAGAGIGYLWFRRVPWDDLDARR
jgi:hypothetical protein